MENKNDLFKEALAKASKLDVKSSDKVFNFVASANDGELALLNVLAALQPDSRKKLVDYWKNLEGSDYAVDMVKDFLNLGKKTKVEASKRNNLKQAEKKTEKKSNNKVKEYWNNLEGNEYANDMIEYPSIKGEKMQVEAFSKDLQKYIGNMPPRLAQEFLGLIKKK